MNKQSYPLDCQLSLDKAVDALKAIPLDGKAMVVIQGVGRSTSQNAALFGVAYPPVMAHMGLLGDQEKEELHQYFCGEFFGWKEKAIFGKRKLSPKRTTTTNEEGKRDLISKSEMSDFYSFVQMRGADAGVYVPDPMPNYEDMR